MPGRLTPRNLGSPLFVGIDEFCRLFRPLVAEKISGTNSAERFFSQDRKPGKHHPSLSRYLKLPDRLLHATMNWRIDWCYLGFAISAGTSNPLTGMPGAFVALQKMPSKNWTH
jgi:hypothetical protein